MTRVLGLIRGFRELASIVPTDWACTPRSMAGRSGSAPALATRASGMASSVDPDTDPVDLVMAATAADMAPRVAAAMAMRAGAAPVWADAVDTRGN